MLVKFDYKLHPSSANIWSRCPLAGQGMLLAEREEPGQSAPGSAAAIGTAKHEAVAAALRASLAAAEDELCFGHRLQEMRNNSAGILKGGGDAMFNQREIGALEAVYEEHIMRANDVWVETPQYMPVMLRGFGNIVVGGTPDVVAVWENRLVILDWKFGGIGVEAEENRQLSFYARAFWWNHAAFVRKDLPVELIIIQPVAGDNAIKRWTRYLDQLPPARLAWEFDYIYPRRRAEAKGGLWCRFCPLRDVCREGKAEIAAKNKFAPHVATAEDFD